MDPHQDAKLGFVVDAPRLYQKLPRGFSPI
jgi:hypothetical protein